MKHEQLSLFTGAPAAAEPRPMPDGFRYYSITFRSLRDEVRRVG
jgi:hypothetical protein